MNHYELAKEILEHTGGSENITQLNNCATRLRMNFKDESKIDLNKIKQINGVLGAAKKLGQYQIIIGTDVSNVCDEIRKMGQIDESAVPMKRAGKLDTLMDIFASIFTPVIPAITAAGMIKAILVICVLLGMNKESQVYSILNFIADAGFYFLPVMLAFSSARKMGCNPYLAVMMGGILLHPNFAKMVSAGDPVFFLGLPVKLVNYGSSVIPIILAVWLMTYVERFADKISPKPVKFLMKPVLTILIVAPVVLIVLGPLGSYVGTVIAAVTDFLNSRVSWLVPMLMGAFMPLLVLTGMHWSFLPILMTSYTTYGYEAVMGPGSLVSNICQGAAALCVAFKTKDRQFKQQASSAGITALMGITEPAMYGVTIKYKKVLVSVMLGGAAGGFYAGLMGVVRYTSGTPGLLSLPIFIGENPMNVIHALVSCTIGFCITFVLTWFYGFKELEKEGDREQDKYSEAKEQVQKSKKIIISSPVNGRKVNLSKVNDETFAKEIAGKGMAVEPSDGRITAPFDGEVVTVFRTKHVIGLRSSEGVELMIHIGIDTVELEGKHFTAYVTDGDVVKTGDLLMEFDKQAIEAAGYETVVPVIVTNTGNYLDIIASEEGTVESGQPLFTVL
ncbi:PTS beta-glucoside transporter subunit EIIBCA [Lacrimispora amygdalina]|uniref:PTS beta-glucoside transporter subunit EIIBCA n=1 Tax=Lacrimispora amygdalina TaxID=253257 RepID=A0A3E2N5F0_9FIRM|nr:beta-glucoside-specific PTS transporter subunit IIABC [Clostridium indicum]RFZ76202.1 PTS beta-glucoside transporter subunit EIIBCA [Clostridium indicum]